MAEDLREDAGEFYPGGTVVPGVPVVPGGEGGGGSSVIADDTLTKDGENPVKSKGIWSAIWGTITEAPKSVYEWVKAELGKKQNKLKQGENIIIAEDGTISASGGSVDVVAEIAGKEIKPSSVVIESDDGRTQKIVVFNGREMSYEERYAGERLSKQHKDWFSIISSIPKYTFYDADLDEETDTSSGLIYINPYSINYVASTHFRSEIKSLKLILNANATERGLFALDFNLVFDCYDEGYRIEWTEEGEEYTFHPRSGDAANLEVVAGKRNVFFVTEVQPNVFMVARDELALPDAGGGE